MTLLIDFLIGLAVFVALFAGLYFLSRKKPQPESAPEVKEPTKVVIRNWRNYGDYMLFAKMVDETKKWIMLESTQLTIIAQGPKDALDDYCKLLDQKKITYSRL